tara:strand:+ start:153 stop:635 length:483 start_codon:yes stop_codon:yes gene_type:complete
MATEYERIDKLMKALAGLISPHIECEDTNIDDFEYTLDEINDRIDSIESSFILKDDLSDTLPDNLVTSDNWEDKTGIYDEIDDRVRSKLNDDIGEYIRDFFNYDGGGDIISEHIDSNIASIVREEVERQLTPERLVSMFIEGLSEAINGNKEGRYTVTVK